MGRFVAVGPGPSSRVAFRGTGGTRRGTSRPTKPLHCHWITYPAVWIVPLQRTILRPW